MRFTKIMSIILSILLVFTVSTAFAAPAPNAKDAGTASQTFQAAGSSKTNPVKTAAELSAALKAVKKGGTIYIGAVTITMAETGEIKKSSVTIKGAGQGKTVLKSPRAGGRHFTVTAAVKATFEDLTLSGPGTAAAKPKLDNGGVLGQDKGALVFNRCTVKNNIENDPKYRYSPYAVYGGTVKMTGCTVSGNTGGVRAAKAALADCKVSNNVLDGVSAEASATLTGCTVSNNSWGVSSIGVSSGDVTLGDVTLKNCTVSGNKSDTNGGGVIAGTVTMTGCIVKNNSAAAECSGGGIYAVTKATLKNCTVANNKSHWSGGGIFISEGSATLTDCAISGNSSPDGGGIYAADFRGNEYGTVTLTNCTVKDNIAGSSGGGVYARTVKLTNCTVSGNTAYGWGGGVEARTANLTNCTVSGNTAKNLGGGVSANNVSLISCTVSGNTAASNNISYVIINGKKYDLTGGAGGGVFAYEKASVKGSIIAGNTSKYGNDVYCAGSIWQDQTPKSPDYNVIGGKLEDIFASVKDGRAILKNNGGATQTIMIKLGGLACDAIPAGKSWLPSVDQRGIKRPQGGRGDAGAVEAAEVS